jgi:branched-chain amino acid transport system permease protein
MREVVVSIFGGAALGSTFALIALGLVLVFRTTGIFNLAHGQLMLVAAYVLADWEQHDRGPFIPGLIIGLAAAAAVAGIFYLVVLRWTLGLPHWIPFVATLVIGNMLDALLAIKYGDAEYAVILPGMPTGTVRILGVPVSSASLITAAIGIALAIIVIAVLRTTRLGTQVRAVGQDPLLASQGGIPVRRFYIGAWTAAGLLAGVAGVLYANTTTVDSSLSGVALLAVPAMVLGGLDSFEGAVIGGILVGIMQGFVTTYLGGQYIDLITYGLLLAVLLVYPRGLFGTANVVKV